jgi:ATP-dependent protease ClpP protease subunit
VIDMLVYAALVALGAFGVGMVLYGALRLHPPARMRRARVFDVPSPPERPAQMPSDTPAPSSFSDCAPGGRINQYPLLAAPHVMLAGPVDHDMYASFRQQLADAPAEGTIVIAISTLGGDPEVARLMGDQVRLMREAYGREFLFLGKVAVYSAGATFMAYFPVDKRFLTRRTRIMIHERLITKTINLSGPLNTCVAELKANLHEIEHSILIQEEGFRAIVEGSRVSIDDLLRRAPENWYIEAGEARDLGLVLDIV